MLDVQEKICYSPGDSPSIFILWRHFMERDELFLTYEKEVAEFKLGLIARLARETSLPKKPGRRRTSNFDMIEKVLGDAGKPLHVSEIIAAVEKEFGVQLDRDSLSSAMGKQIRKEVRFNRVAPNTFGLKQE
jgi:dTDP-4-dehydrorhamnose reductase